MADRRLDPFSPDARADPYPIYRNLREQAPIHWSEPLGGWLVSRYEDVSKVLTDARFSSAPQVPARLPPALKSALGPFGRAQTMLTSDPPEHTRLRRLVSTAFTPKAIDRLGERIDDVVCEFLNSFPTTGAVDLMAELAEPVPGIIIAEMIGVPTSDRRTFKALSNDVVAGFISPALSAPESMRQGLASMSKLTSYLQEIIRHRRRCPEEDLISGLLAAEERGDALSEDEIIVSAIMVLVAGNETTTNAIGNGMLALLEHPDQMRLLREDPTLAAGAMEELLRFAGLSQSVKRIARETVELNGREILRGDLVVALLAAANRDPAKFEDPDRLDIKRDASEHVAFGDGSHFCLGASLARAVMGRAIPAVLDRFPRIRVADTCNEWNSGSIRGLKRLVVDL